MILSQELLVASAIILLITGCSTAKIEPAKASKSSDVEKHILSNRMTVLLRSNPLADVIVFNLFIKSGVRFENESNNGISNLLQKTIIKGTKKRTAVDIVREIEAAGGSIESSASHDFSEIKIMSIARNYRVCLSLLEDIVKNPQFPSTEIDKEKNVILAQIKSQEDKPFDKVYKLTMKNTYPGHPYGLSPLGEAESVKKISKEDLVRRFQNGYIPENMILSISGKFQKNLLEEIVGAFNSLKKPEVLDKSGINYSSTGEAKDKATYFQKEINQTQIMFAYHVPSITDENFVAMKVINTILGEGMSSRLFTQLRDKEGLAYTVGSFMPSRRDESRLVIYMGTAPENLEKALDGIKREVERIKTDLVGNEDFLRAKNYLMGTFALDHRTNSRQAWYNGFYETLDPGFQFDRIYPKKIESISPEDVKKTANKFLNNPTIVILAPPEKSK